MKKIIFMIMINSLWANNCSLENLEYLLKDDKNTFNIIDKSSLLIPNHNEQLKFFYNKKNKELSKIEYQGFSSVHSLEITYYFGNKGNILVKIVKKNYTDYLGSKVIDVFAKQTTFLPLCDNYKFDDLNYNGFKEEYNLLLKFKKFFPKKD